MIENIEYTVTDSHTHIAVVREGLVYSVTYSHTRIAVRRGSRIQKGGFVQEFRLENRSYPDVQDFSLCMQVIIAND